MNIEITANQIKKYREQFENDGKSKISQNAVTNVPLPKLTLNRNLVQEMDSSFSIKLDKWSVTNQKSSGRCWLFATLNLFRPGAMEKMNIKDFEFSQAHIHFWDKVERSNHLLESYVHHGNVTTSHYCLKKK